LLPAEDSFGGGLRIEPVVHRVDGGRCVDPSVPRVGGERRVEPEKRNNNGETSETKNNNLKMKASNYFFYSKLYFF